MKHIFLAVIGIITLYVFVRPFTQKMTFKLLRKFYGEWYLSWFKLFYYLHFLAFPSSILILFVDRPFRFPNTVTNEHTLLTETFSFCFIYFVVFSLIFNWKKKWSYRVKYFSCVYFGVFLSRYLILLVTFQKLPDYFIESVMHYPLEYICKLFVLFFCLGVIGFFFYTTDLSIFNFNGNPYERDSFEYEYYEEELKKQRDRKI